MAKTAQERAQELVAASKTKVDRLQKRYDKAKTEFDKVSPLLEEAKAELEFAQSHPALRNVANESDIAADTVEAKGLAERPAAAPAVEQVPGQQALPVEPAPEPVAAGAQGTDPFAAFG